MTRTRPTPRGMTLVEVLIAGGIMVFGMAGILTMFTTAVRFHKRAADEYAAAATGESVLAALRAEFDAGRVPPSTRPGDRPSLPAYPDYAYEVAIGGGGAKGGQGNNVYTVEVRVYWKARGEERTQSFRTLMFRRSPFP